MSDNIRTVQVGNRTIDLCYGSDLYWLWAWFDRINAYLFDEDEEGPPPPPGEWLGPYVFYPLTETTEALMRFSASNFYAADYGYLVSQINKFLDFAEQSLTAFINNSNEDTKDVLFTAITELHDVIEPAILVIAENEAQNGSGDGEYSEKVYTPKELRSMFKISQTTLTNWIKGRKIRVIEITSKKLKIHKDDVPKT